MSLVDSLKPLARHIRGTVPGTIGTRVHTVAIVTATWSGTHTGEGARAETTLPLTEGGGHPPKVRWLNDEELAVGNLGRGTVEVGPITSEGGGGLTLAQIQADALATGGALYLQITGPQHRHGARYRITDFRLEKALHYMIRAVPVEERDAIPE